MLCITNNARRSIIILLIIMTGLTGLSSVCQATYSRDEALSYLKSNVFGSTTALYDVWGSDTILTQGTYLVEDKYTPSYYNSWLFVFDFDYGAAWSHGVEFYCVNTENLAQYSVASANNLPNVGLDRLESQVEVYLDDLGNQDATVIQYPTPDPNLKAILISGCLNGGGVEAWTYFSLARWYVMLKHLGYGDIRVFHGEGFGWDEEEAIYTIDTPANYVPYVPPTGNDFDNDDTDDITGPAYLADILEGFEDLATDCDEDDRVVVYISNHGVTQGIPWNGNPTDDHYIGLMGQDFLDAETLCNALLDFTDVVELFVFIDACHSAAMLLDDNNPPQLLEEYAEGFYQSQFSIMNDKITNYSLSNMYSNCVCNRL